MHAVFRKILAAFDIHVAESKEDAESVIVPPSGALLESYGFPDLLAERLRGTGHLPLLIFPSSALFPTRDPAFMFEGRDAAAVWMLREAPSLNHLTDRWGPSLTRSGVELVLSHDVVAIGHEFVPELIGRPSARPKTLLIAPRADRERTTAISESTAESGSSAGPGLLSGWAEGRALGRRIARFMRKERTEFLATQLSTRLDPEVLALLVRGSQRRLCLDLSSAQFCSFTEYARELRKAECVITDRLHVALPAAILGAEVYIAEAGYHKLRGVYDNSLSQLPNVHLVV
ncbi:hypothetical protein [Curtobacterium sp. VKM Ac-1376]|uniref:hypothetical protein n=1 Tax=Curtobacterium sp. VKM Ac-1376 TaxID=123312 RepID=UPI00188A0202|nr:hypothetical protein [Curtobacterium sp. VKM Ac-1376]MBF4614145.1 hypothetical protein [Curtobacterium sp. VKM Ac-1376]